MSKRKAAWRREAGFQLGAMHALQAGDTWRHFRKGALTRLLRRMELLAVSSFALSLERRADVVVAKVTTERRLTFAVADDAGVREALEPLLVQIDELLAADGIPHRFCVSCERSWFGCFVHLLPRDVDVPLFFEAATIDERVSQVVPRLARIRDVVPEARIFSSDFKCSARPSDIEELLASLLAFATLEDVRVGIVMDDGRWKVSVRDGRRQQEAWIEDQKYVDVAPVLPLFDVALARRERPNRLYRFWGDGFDDGICLASPEEATELTKLQYFVDPYR